MAQSIPVHEVENDGNVRATGSARRNGTVAKLVRRDALENPALRLGRAAVEALQPSTQPAVLKKPLDTMTTSVISTSNPVETDAAALQLAIDVRKAQEGDALAMTQLIESNRAWVRGIAYTVLGDAHLAEDAAQEVCVRVVKHLKGLDTPEAFRPWVYRMTRNVALSMAQRRERSPQPLSLDAEQMQEPFRAYRSELPSAALEADEKVNTILEMIGRLPEIYREVLVLKHVQDLSYTEMSSILGVSVKSLEVRLVRARKLLQERLGRRFDRGRRRDPRDER